MLHVVHRLWSARGTALTCGALASALCLCGNRTAAADERRPPAATHNAAPAAESELTPAILLDDLEASARAKQVRLQRLRRQLEQLAEESRRVRAESANAPVPEPPREQPSIPNAGAAPLDSPPPQADAAPPVHEEDVPATPVDDAHGAPAPDGAAVTPPESHHAAPHEPRRAADREIDHGVHAAGVDAHASPPTEVVVGTRINRLALADSLFATGQAELALQAYDSIKTTKLAASDRYWIEYQIANCHRRLGNLPESEKRYRRLAGLVDGGWCAAHARWWLDALSTRTALQRDLGQIKHTLQSVEEQMNAGVNP